MKKNDGFWLLVILTVKHFQTLSAHMDKYSLNWQMELCSNDLPPCLGSVCVCVSFTHVGSLSKHIAAHPQHFSWNMRT